MSTLVLVCRNDVIHEGAGVSRDAYHLLCKCLELCPYAVVVVEEAHGGAPPRVAISCDAAWVPLVAHW